MARHMAPRVKPLSGMRRAFAVLAVAQALSLVAVPVLVRVSGQVAAVVAIGVATGLTLPIAILGGALVCEPLFAALDGEGKGSRAPFSPRSLAEPALAVASVLVTVLLLLPRGGAYFGGENPYSNKDRLQCVVTFVVGREFSVPGTTDSDGVVIKAPEGSVVRTPSVVAKPGLTFTGWRYAGVGDPDVGPDAEIVLDANGTKNNAVTLFAQFVDEAGNAYCSCGAYGDGIFTGAGWQGMASGWQRWGAIVALLASIVVIFLVMNGSGRGNGDKVIRRMRPFAKAAPDKTLIGGVDGPVEVAADTPTDDMASQPVDGGGTPGMPATGSIGPGGDAASDAVADGDGEEGATDAE